MYSAGWCLWQISVMLLVCMKLWLDWFIHTKIYKKLIFQLEIIRSEQSKARICAVSESLFSFFHMSSCLSWNGELESGHILFRGMNFWCTILLSGAFFDMYLGDVPVSEQTKEEIGRNVASIIRSCWTGSCICIASLFEWGKWFVEEMNCSQGQRCHSRKALQGISRGAVLGTFGGWSFAYQSAILCHYFLGIYTS